jgi:Ankyrin repeats (3 copies)
MEDTVVTHKKPFAFLSRFYCAALMILICSCGSSANLNEGIEKEDAALIKKLVDNNADVNQYSDFGWTPLLTSTRKGNLEIVKILLAHGAEVNAKNSNGWSALLIASRYGYPEILKCLIEHGAYIHTCNHQDWDALTLAAWAGHTKIIDILINEGIRLNTKGKNALYYTGLNNRPDIVEYLLEKGVEFEFFEESWEDLFSAGVINKVMGQLEEEKGNYSLALVNYTNASKYFSEAVPKLNEVIDAIETKESKDIFLSILGVIASSADLSNVRSGNRSAIRYSEIVPRTSNASNGSKEWYEEVIKESKNKCSYCEKKIEELKKKNS